MGGTDPKFQVGQIVVMTGLKKEPPFRILKTHWDNDTGWSYAWDRKNFAAEHMIRKLTSQEIGT